MRKENLDTARTPNLESPSYKLTAKASSERTQLKGNGVKHDDGKPQLSLIPRHALEEEARTMMLGNEKYGRGNWRKGMKWSRLIDATLRHVYAFAGGENTDPESGISHLAHARACCAFLIEYAALHPELDDRFEEATKNPKDAAARQMTYREDYDPT